MKKSTNYNIKIRSSAEADIAEIIDWYEDKLKGLGARFFDEVEAMIDLIKAHPYNFPIKYPPYRMALVEVFPIKIWFKVEHETIVVTAVIHAYRKDENWLKRI
ncbi:type II toxin-antitoxin system RelE/ParE family toxin [bacterium]|nr:type II toxin-antitoxin system RelE/ParE family toxin [bacterium]